jgi:hypothetical protein
VMRWLKNAIILQITSTFQYYRERQTRFKKKVDGQSAQFQNGNAAVWAPANGCSRFNVT